MLRVDNEVTIKWAPLPSKPVQTPSLQKAQLFAWTHWGPKKKASCVLAASS